MTETFDGESIARQRIAEEAERRTGFLDLSQLGLTELPAELFTLRHLRCLKLGWRLTVKDGVLVTAGWNNPPNRLGENLGALAALPHLEALSVCQTDCASLDFLALLDRLKWLDCSNTQVSSLGPLAKLTDLQFLDCKSTKISELGPLAKLTALQSIRCRSTQFSDLSLLATLTGLQ